MLIHKVDRSPQGPKPSTLFPYLPQGSTGSGTRSPQSRPARVASGKAHSGQAGRRVCVCGVERGPPKPGSPLQPNIQSGRHREIYQHAKRSSLGPCSTSGLKSASSGVFQRSQPPPEGSAAPPAPPTGLPSALVRAGRKLADAGAEKRRAKFLLISYEWGESVCKTHC